MIIVDDILCAPWSGFKFILKQIQKQVNQELLDESLVQEKLLELEFAYELGEINKDEYEEEHMFLLDKLRQIKEYKAAQKVGEEVDNE